MQAKPFQYLVGVNIVGYLRNDKMSSLKPLLALTSNPIITFWYPNNLII